MVIIKESNGVITSSLRARIKAAQEEVNSLSESIADQFRNGFINKELYSKLWSSVMDAHKALARTASYK